MSEHMLGEGCECAVSHTPSAYVAYRHHVVPLEWGGTEDESNIVVVCPNTDTAIHHLLDLYLKADGVPEWNVRRQYGPYARALAARGWINRRTT